MVKKIRDKDTPEDIIFTYEYTHSGRSVFKAEFFKGQETKDKQILGIKLNFGNVVQDTTYFPVLVDKKYNNPKSKLREDVHKKVDDFVDALLIIARADKRNTVEEIKHSYGYLSLQDFIDGTDPNKPKEETKEGKDGEHKETTTAATTSSGDRTSPSDDSK